MRKTTPSQPTGSRRIVKLGMTIGVSMFLGRLIASSTFARTPMLTARDFVLLLPLSLLMGVIGTWIAFKAGLGDLWD